MGWRDNLDSHHLWGDLGDMHVMTLNLNSTLIVGALTASQTPMLPGDAESIGPATRCDAAHLRWGVSNPLRCKKIACDARRCKFEHVGNYAPDIGISQLFIVRFLRGFQHNNRHLVSSFVIWSSIILAKYFNMLSLRCKSQERMETFHRQ